MIKEYQKSIHRLDRIYETILKTELDDHIASLLAAHICVLQSGILENLIKETLTEFSEKRSDKSVARFVKRRISAFQNPKTGNIEEIFNAFDASWLEKLKSFWDTNEIKEHVNSIVANRHQIAHGRGTVITIHQTKEWLKSLKRFVEFIEETCNT